MFYDVFFIFTWYIMSCSVMFYEIFLCSRVIHAMFYDVFRDVHVVYM
jgi:hypothetical protein